MRDFSSLSKTQSHLSAAPAGLDELVSVRINLRITSVHGSSLRESLALQEQVYNAGVPSALELEGGSFSHGLRYAPGDKTSLAQPCKFVLE